MITQIKGCAKGTRLISKRVGALLVAIAALCACTAFAASPRLMNKVDIYDGSEITRVETLRKDPSAIIKQAGIVLNSGDVLNLDRFVAGEDSIITVYRASTIEYTDIDGTVSKVVFAGTVRQFLDSKGIVADNTVLISENLSTVVYNGMKLSVQPAHRVSVLADERTIDITIGNGTVKDALLLAGISLSEDDEAQPSLDTAVGNGMTIEVFRVTYELRTVKETVAFSKETKNTNTLYKGTTKVEQNGENGTKEITYKDKYVNGSLDSSSLVGEKITKEPVNQITLVGTKEKPKAVAAVKKGGAAISELAVPASLNIVNGVPTNYKSVVYGKSSAYYDVNHTGATASGRPAKPGYIAVNPEQFPYGTEMWIVATDGTVYGYCIAADTGGFAKKGRITVDLLMNTRSECNAWGVKDVIIYVLN